MNNNNYGEIINGEETYKAIANRLLNNETVGIGWSDEEYTHFDIIFKLGLDCKVGDFQRGIRRDYLFVGIIGHAFYGFVPDTLKETGYITEKIGFRNDKLSELINGIIKCMNESCKTNE